MFSPDNLEGSNFVPIPDLDQKDADLTIMMLTNKVRNTNPVEDTWFMATQKIDLGFSNIYLPNEPFVRTSRVRNVPREKLTKF